MRHVDFERAERKALVTTRIAEEYLQSGWCARCGYKRLQRGNCPNCDHWYTHPVLTIGGALTTCLLLLLFIGIRSVRDADPNFEKLSQGLLNAAPAPAYIPTTPMTPAQTAPPVYFQSVTPVAVSFAKQPIPAIEKQATQLEDLRETVHVAERAYQRSTTTAPQASAVIPLRSASRLSGTQAVSSIF